MTSSLPPQVSSRLSDSVCSQDSPPVEKAKVLPVRLIVDSILHPRLSGFDIHLLNLPLLVYSIMLFLWTSLTSSTIGTLGQCFLSTFRQNLSISTKETISRFSPQHHWAANEKPPMPEKRSNIFHDTMMAPLRVPSTLSLPDRASYS